MSDPADGVPWQRARFIRGDFRGRAIWVLPLDQAVFERFMGAWRTAWFTNLVSDDGVLVTVDPTWIALEDCTADDVPLEAVGWHLGPGAHWVDGPETPQ